MKKHNILECQMIGKSGPEKCEDAYLITDHFVAVVDGSTSKSSLPPLACRLSHGQIAAKCVCRFVASCPPDITMEAFCEGVTEMLRAEYHVFRPELTSQHLTDHPEDRFTCSAIIYSAFHNEIWMIGDCHCLLTSHPGATARYYDNPKPMEDILAAQRAEVIERLLSEGASPEDIRHNDQGRAAIIDRLKESMKAQNHDYAVIDGFPIPTDKVKVISTHGIQEVVLASDGYPRLFPTLAESEAYLHNLLSNDPLLIREYKATKCWNPINVTFDDRCYIRFTLPY